jgi:hypothetical protein
MWQTNFVHACEGKPNQHSSWYVGFYLLHLKKDNGGSILGYWVNLEFADLIELRKYVQKSDTN